MRIFFVCIDWDPELVFSDGLLDLVELGLELGTYMPFLHLLNIVWPWMKAVVS